MAHHYSGSLSHSFGSFGHSFGGGSGIGQMIVSSIIHGFIYRIIFKLTEGMSLFGLIIVAAVVIGLIWLISGFFGRRN